MRDFIYQGDEHSCGYATLRMFTIIKKKDPRYRYMGIKGEGPYSLEDLKEQARAEGMDIKFIKVNNKEDLRTNDRYPIMLVLEEGEGTHMVLLKKSWKGRYLIYDPAKGKAWIKEDDLIARWTGVYGDGDIVENTPCKYKKPSILPWNYNVATLIAVIGEVYALLAGFYHLNEEGNFLQPVTYFSAYAIFEILRHLVVERYMKRFDDKYKNLIINSKKGKIREDYRQFSMFKAYLFSSITNLVASCVMTLILTILMGINSPSFFLSFGALACYQVFSTIFIGMGVKDKTLALAKKEEKMLENKEGREEALSIMFKDSYSIMESLSYKRLLEVLVILLVSLIPFVVDQNFTLNFYLFNCFSMLIIHSAMKGIEDYVMNTKERRINEEYFLMLLMRDSEVL